MPQPTFEQLLLAERLRKLLANPPLQPAGSDVTGPSMSPGRPGAVPAAGGLPDAAQHQAMQRAHGVTGQNVLGMPSIGKMLGRSAWMGTSGMLPLDINLDEFAHRMRYDPRRYRSGGEPALDRAMTPGVSDRAFSDALQQNVSALGDATALLGAPAMLGEMGARAVGQQALRRAAPRASSTTMLGDDIAARAPTRFSNPIGPPRPPVPTPSESPGFKLQAAFDDKLEQGLRGTNQLALPPPKQGPMPQPPPSINHRTRQMAHDMRRQQIQAGVDSYTGEPTFAPALETRPLHGTPGGSTEINLKRATEALSRQRALEAGNEDYLGQIQGLMGNPPPPNVTPNLWRRGNAFESRMAREQSRMPTTAGVPSDILAGRAPTQFDRQFGPQQDLLSNQPVMLPRDPTPPPPPPKRYETPVFPQPWTANDVRGMAPADVAAPPARLRTPTPANQKVQMGSSLQWNEGQTVGGFQNPFRVPKQGTEVAPMTPQSARLGASYGIEGGPRDWLPAPGGVGNFVAGVPDELVRRAILSLLGAGAVGGASIGASLAGRQTQGLAQLPMTQTSSVAPYAKPRY